MLNDLHLPGCTPVDLRPPEQVLRIDALNDTIYNRVRSAPGVLVGRKLKSLERLWDCGEGYHGEGGLIWCELHVLKP